MQVSSDESDGEIYFVAPVSYLGDKRTAYGRHIQFTLTILNFSAPNYDVISATPGDDVIIQGLYVDFSLVAQLPQLPSRYVTYYTVIYLCFCVA